MIYELADREGFNLVGTYADQDLALLAVLETIRESGEEAAETLSLAATDPTGQAEDRLIAQGPYLMQLARDRWLNAEPWRLAV